MEDKELIIKIIQFKRDNKYTLYDLSRKLDLHISTIERWLKTNRINKVYAQMIKEKLGIR